MDKSDLENMVAVVDANINRVREEQGVAADSLPSLAAIEQQLVKAMTEQDGQRVLLALAMLRCRLPKPDRRDAMSMMIHAAYEVQPEKSKAIVVAVKHEDGKHSVVGTLNGREMPNDDMVSILDGAASVVFQNEIKRRAESN